MSSWFPILGFDWMRLRQRGRIIGERLEGKRLETGLHQLAAASVDRFRSVQPLTEL